MRHILRRLIQNLIIFFARPYIVRELPGWGKIYVAMVGDYRRDWLWADGPVKTIRGKLTGYKMRLDLSKWADRSAYFLGRWVNLELQLLIADYVKPGDTVLDVGANRGMFTLAASHAVGERGKVISFEPNPNVAGILSEQIAANEISNIQLNRYGLSDRDAELTLIVPRINSGEGSFRQTASEHDNTYAVGASVRKGDDCLDQIAPNLIKIDVEGFEPKVIAGLSKTIEKHHPVIVTEVVARHLEACGGSVAGLAQQMHSLGYRGYKFDLRKKAGAYTWWLSEFSKGGASFDAIWLHSKYLDRDGMFARHMDGALAGPG